MRKLSAVFVMAAGVFGSYLLVQSGRWGWMIPTALLTLYVASGLWIEEAETTSWHYRLINLYFDEKRIKKLCKTCPYMGLFTASVLALLIEVLSTIIWMIIVNVGWPLAASWMWFWGGVPRTWMIPLGNVVHREEKYFLTGDDRGDWRRENWMYWRSTPLVPWFITGVGVLLTLIIYLALTLAGVKIDLHWIAVSFGWLGWIYVWPAAYGALITLIVLGRGWYHLGWPLTKWSTRKAYGLCPGIRIVEPAQATAQPKQGNKNGPAPART